MKALLSFTLCVSMLVQPAWAQSLNETFNNTPSLTDREQVQANEYYHQGIADKYLTEECKKLKTGCDDSSSRPGNVLGGFEEVLPKLYAVMGTLAAAGVGGKIQMKPKPVTAPTDGSTPPEPERREKTDVCIYIPMVGEAVSSFTQQQAEQQIQQTNIQTAADLQKEALYAVARTHQSRAKTAKMQASIYAATGACYVSYLAMGAIANPMFIAKLGASVAMSAIFFKKAGKHKEYANKLKEIAKNLPGSGECNPFTNTNCFCSEDSSYKTDPGNFNRFCVAKAIVNNGPPGTQVACATISSTGATVDPSCACRRTNSCANVQLGGLAGQIGLGAISFKDPLSILDNSTGSFDDGTVGTFGEGLNARNANVLNGNSGSIPDIGVNGKTKEIADKIASLGVPANVSGLIANQSNGSMPDSAAAGPALAADGATGAQEGTAGRAKVPGYNSSTNSRGFVGSNDPGFVNPLDSLNKSKKPPSIQVETFAERAIREAEISNDTSRGLFEIISNRYRNSGWGQETSNPIP